MTTGTMTRTQSQGQTQIDVQSAGLSPNEIRSIQLADGWQDVQNCQFVHFAVGVPHSPITPGKLYPTLKYTNNQGNEVYTPLSAISSFSNQSNQGSNRNGGNSGNNR